MNSAFHRGGLSLLEVVVALAVTSIILLGIGSAMLFAGRALPGADSAANRAAAGSAVLEAIVEDLRYAVAIQQRSERMIQFTVADRNADSMPEVIRYEWSGTAGAPLTCQYNGAALEVLPGVQDLVITYDLQTISTEIPQSNESAETLLIGYDSAQDYADYTIKDGARYGEYFRPVLPAEAVSWKVTRVRFSAKQSGAAVGEARVRICPATTGGKPSGVVLEEKALQESLLPVDYLVQELTYTQVSGISPQQGLCLVFRWQSDAEACKILGQDKNVSAGNIALLKSTDKGMSWTAQTAQSLLFSVYGTVTTAGTPQVQSRYYLQAVTLRLKAGATDETTVQSTIRTLNQPEVSL